MNDTSRAASARAARAARLLAVIGWVSLGSACEERREIEIDTPPPAALVARRPPPASAPAPAPSERAADAGAPRARPSERAEPKPVDPVETLDASPIEGSRQGRWIVDALVDVAAAGPAMAAREGVVMVNRNNELWLAPLARLAAREQPSPTPVLGLPASAGPFPLSRGPAVHKGFAYWVSQGHLLRQRLARANAGSAPEVLTSDARAGTRVAVPTGEAGARLPALAGYIAAPAGPDLPLTAKLWVEGAPGPLSLTDEGASAHSLALIAEGQGVHALSLEARTGLSPLHLRRVDLARGSVPLLDEDRVAWVGGSSRPTTEILVLGHERSETLVALALERDITHFGLALLELGLGKEAPLPEPAWMDYANGIEPAPFALASVCGQRVVVLARPASAEPGSPQELLWQSLDARGREPPLVLGRSRAFFDVSLAAVPGGALLTYVADRRTWARSVRCSK